ncbi:MAG TPA: hypothetical protein VIW26_01185 [Gemmatimonadales bacterium]
MFTDLMEVAMRLVQGLTAAALLAAPACTHAVVVQRGPRAEAVPPPGREERLGIPPGHMPRPGECRVWIPGTPPGRQPRPRSRPCAGIERDAPAGSWIVYRPGQERRFVHVRVVDERRAGVVVRVRVFEAESGRFVREENP